jgi:hypothetical protein
MSMSAIVSDYRTEDTVEQIMAGMVGVTFTEVTGAVGDERIRFLDIPNARGVTFYYEHDCCAHCSVADICGDLSDLVGSPIVVAEEVSNQAEPAGFEPSNHDSYTWTFYRFATVKGTVTIRWFGESNGYYSEFVSVVRDGKWAK